MDYKNKPVRPASGFLDIEYFPLIPERLKLLEELEEQYKQQK